MLSAVMDSIIDRIFSHPNSLSVLLAGHTASSNRDLESPLLLVPRVSTSLRWRRMHASLRRSAAERGTEGGWKNVGRVRSGHYMRLHTVVLRAVATRDLRGEGFLFFLASTVLVLLLVISGGATGL